jgi:hypothetical protein
MAARNISSRSTVPRTINLLLTLFYRSGQNPGLANRHFTSLVFQWEAPDGSPHAQGQRPGNAR